MILKIELEIVVTSEPEDMIGYNETSFREELKKELYEDLGGDCVTVSGINYLAIVNKVVDA
jgi:hypothetical protein